MDNPILDFSASFAKPAELVRAQEALRALFPGAIAAERARLDAELVEPAPVPTASQCRQRKRSLSKVVEAARKAGADRVIIDGGVVIALAPAAAMPNGDGQQAAPVEAANPWDSVLLAKGDDHGPH